VSFFFIRDSRLLARRGRRWAARAAVWAGCEQGQDTQTLTDADRASWRARARQWMYAELNDAAAAPDAIADVAAPIHKQAKFVIMGWLRSPDFARVRDPEALARLPAAEEREWKVLWQRMKEFVETINAKS
jgi:hypothetical protein